MAETITTQPSEWELDHVFVNEDGSRIMCDRDACALGSYVLEIEDGELYAPACTTCEFTANCDSVFNEDEPRFQPGAPEEFKQGAARVLVSRPSLLAAIRLGRPETAEMITSYATPFPSNE